jgi:hypothetical protein
VVECVEGTPALDLELERLVRSLIDDTHGHATGRLVPEQLLRCANSAGRLLVAVLMSLLRLANRSELIAHMTTDCDTRGH